MKMMQGDLTFKQDADAARDANFAKADADGDGFLNSEENLKFEELQLAWRTEKYGP